MNPKMKRVIGLGLFSFVVVAVAFAVVKEMESGNRTMTQENAMSGETASDPTKSKEDRVVVYYFHGPTRCISCFTIEKYSYEALHSAFKDELANGSMEWRVVNVGEASNRHFIEKYKLYTKSIVVSAVKANKEIKSKILEKIWYYLGDKDKFVAYIQSEVKEIIPLVHQ